MMTRMLFSLFGGIALFLYGLRLAGEGFQRTAAGRLRHLLSAITRNRLMAAGMGVLITLVLQSSGAMVGMLVRFAGSGLLQLPQAMGVILGADIGTTLTVQLIAFRFFALSLFFIGFGFFTVYLAKRRRFADLGQGILGFGLIFLGMKVMVEALEPLKGSGFFQEVLLSLEEQPFLVIILSALFTGFVASSAATIGFALTLAHQGLLPLSVAIPWIFGANIGTCTSSLAASMGGGTEAKRVAVAHILFKVLGVLLFLPLIHPFARFVGMTAADPARQVANAHTLFNVLIALLFLPFIGPGAKVIARLVPEERRVEDPFKPRYLDEHLLEAPALALAQATREALRIADIVSEMLHRTGEALFQDDQELIEAIERKDDQVDALEREVKRYLTKLSQQLLTDEQSRREVAILAFVNDLENIGDIVERNLMELAKKRLSQGAKFSEEGVKEIQALHAKVCQNLETAISAFASHDPFLAQKVLDRRSEIGQMERSFRQSHIARLHEGLPESIETSEIHLDILTNLKRINSHVSAIAHSILEAL